MAKAQDRLEQLKANMSSQQRADMAEVIANEIKRRESATSNTVSKNMVSNSGLNAQSRVKLSKKSTVGSSKLSGGLSAGAVENMVNESSENIRKLRLQKLEQRLAELKGDSHDVTMDRDMDGDGMSRKNMSYNENFPSSNSNHGKRKFLPSTNAVLLYGVVGFGVLKILFSTGVVNAATIKSFQRDSQVPVVGDNTVGDNGAHVSQFASNKKVEQASNDAVIKNSTDIRARKNPVPSQGNSKDMSQNRSAVDIQLLEQLDARRVALEERNIELDAREKQLNQESAALSERLAELRSLSTKLETIRKEKDQRYETRIEQLADVYGSMVPQQAAPLIAKLEDETALGLLQRMPGKRMGQILSLMNEDRAIELTKRLTDRKSM